jgi:D-ribulokinase
MARIEASAYNLLYRLGATAVEEVLTAGGGAANPVWTAIRSTALGLPVHPSPHGRRPLVWPCAPSVSTSL